MRIPLQAYLLAAATLIGSVGVAGTLDRMPAETPSINRGDITCSTDSECHALDHHRVLIGIGCGPDKVTSYALEEDEFGFDHCDVIEARRVVGEWGQSTR